ncbi:MAG: glycerol-3-phosphate dehydrogenase, partial [Clostridia bacterium]|nr:glycerol-3-phosphate dehydrogenase [Clostridia bacterium]
YVTVYGGRTRQIGILLGRGFDIDDARSELHGVTLESLVVAERVARAIRIQAANNTVRLSDYPLLMHVDDILHHAPVQIPWDRFTFEQF